LIGHRNQYHLVIWIVSLLLVGCATSQPAPVIERAPIGKSSAPPAKAAKPATEKDWRPETYTVKKGDTLYSIGLEFGYDYKEIAQANNIQPPHVIRIGQQLKLPAKNADALASKPAASREESGVTVTPLKPDAPAANTTATSVSSNEPPLISEPKALREPYSVQAMAAPIKPPVVPTAPVAVKPADAPIAAPETPKADVPTAPEDDTVDWGWPTNGKVIAGFNEASNAKGIDISGSQGQAINAAGAGKVIYSGSDLRGYGKLVIIKHNKTYLSVYAHNSQIVVKEGQQISKGQKIAEMGNTDTDRVKLHFEIRKLGKSVDPAKFLSSSP